MWRLQLWAWQRVILSLRLLLPLTAIAPTASAAASNAPASATTAPAPSEAQVLTSRDNAISLSVKGNFQDQSAMLICYPKARSSRKHHLIAQDAVSDITAYVNLANPKNPPKNIMLI